jgi:hypothetical protein
MSKSAKSMFIFALYLFILGPMLLIIPNVLLAPFGFPQANEVWVRVTGMLVIILGYYYIQAVRNELKAFFKATVIGRISVLVFFAVFVLLDYAPPTLILLTLPDTGGAIWTALCLKAEKKNQ